MNYFIEKISQILLGFGNEFWAAIIGAIIGGIITGIWQFLAFKRENNILTHADLKRKQALGRSLVFKLMRIVSNIKRIDDHLRNCLGDPKEASIIHPWQYVLPIPNLPKEIELSSDEISLLMQNKNHPIINNLLDLHHIHNSNIELFKVYNTKREDLRKTLPASGAQGREFSLRLNAEELLKFRPLMLECNDILRSLHIRGYDDYLLSTKILNEVGEHLNKEIDLGLDTEIIDEHKPDASS